MKRAFRAGVSALAIAAVPGLAAALTAEQAWQAWQDAAAEADMALSTGEERMEAGALTVGALALAAELDDEGATLTATLSEVVFAEQADGSVAVRLPEVMPVTISGTDDDGEASSVAMTVTQTDMALTMADGPSGGLETTYDAPRLVLALESLTEAGEARDMTAAVSVSGAAGSVSRSGDDVPVVESVFAADAMEVDVSGTDDESGGTFDLAFTAADMRTRSSGTLSGLTTISDDLDEMLEDGFTTDAEGSIGAMTFAVSAEGMPESLTAEGAMTGASGALAIDPERLRYELGYDGIDFTASGSEIPLPQVTGALGRLGLLIEVPTQSETPGDMALRVALEDLTLGEAIWSLVDPAGAIPRDPASLVVDLAGTVRLIDDIFDADEMAEADGAMPAEVQSVDINELRLSLAGAALTGAGAFTFDWSAPGPFGPGTPAPDGTLNLQLDGGQALLDTLVQMGLLRQEDAMMARMMTGMLAVPGDGPDELVSEITVSPDGSILANGTPLPF